jgi:hypothetical protein
MQAGRGLKQELPFFMFYAKIAAGSSTGGNSEVTLILCSKTNRKGSPHLSIT